MYSQVKGRRVELVKEFKFFLLHYFKGASLFANQQEKVKSKVYALINAQS